MKKLFAGITIALAGAGSAAADTISFSVSAQDTVYFAGHTHAELTALAAAAGYGPGSYYGDLSDPDTLPTSISVTGFSSLSITASGFWSHCSSGCVTGPDGYSSATSQPQYGVFGISLVQNTPINALIGVFTGGAPDPGSTPVSSSGITTTPLLNQSFLIGSSLADIIVPFGATNLSFGLHNGYEWTNNVGSVTVTVERTPSVPEPGTLALLGLGLVAMAAVRRRAA